MSDRPMVRPAFCTARVKCTNPDCSDHDADRIIELPQLGDGVFLMPTTTGILGLPVLNLLCGTCSKTDFMQWSSLEVVDTGTQP